MCKAFTLLLLPSLALAQSGADPLMGGPAPIDDAQLAELGIRVVAPPREDA